MATKYPISDPSEERWYYLEPGEVQPGGPILLSELREIFDKKKVHKKSIVWRKGMNHWEPIENIPQLKPQRSIFSFSFLGFGRKMESKEEIRPSIEKE